MAHDPDDVMLIRGVTTQPSRKRVSASSVAPTPIKQSLAASILCRAAMARATASKHEYAAAHRQIGAGCR